jgi:hypothetical protein
MTPTEHEATVAVEAAARAAFRVQLAETAEQTQISIERYSDWDDIGPVAQLGWRQQVLPLVWAALEAIPDRRHEAWLLGHLAPNNAVNPYPGVV